MKTLLSEKTSRTGTEVKFGVVMCNVHHSALLIFALKFQLLIHAYHGEFIIITIIIIIIIIYIYILNNLFINIFEANCYLQ